MKAQGDKKLAAAKAAARKSLTKREIGDLREAFFANGPDPR